jgi:hypothetical protein
MSTTSVRVVFEDDFYDGRSIDPERRSFVGTLRFHHTSDTVTWSVDGQQQWIITPGEFAALEEAFRKMKASI